MSFVNIARYRKELIDTADVICSLLNEEELKSLEIIRNNYTISFRDQIVITYHNHYLMHSPEKTKIVANLAIKKFKPFFLLKDYKECRINKILLERFKNSIFEDEEGYFKISSKVNKESKRIIEYVVKTFSKEHLECLSIRKKGKVISFQEQLLIRYSNKCPIYKLEKIENQIYLLSINADFEDYERLCNIKKDIFEELDKFFTDEKPNKFIN